MHQMIQQKPRISVVYIKKYYQYHLILYINILKKVVGGNNADMINIQEIQIFGKELLILIQE